MVANNKLRGYWGEDRFVFYDLDPVHEEELYNNETEWSNILDDIYVNTGKSVNSYYRTRYDEITALKVAVITNYRITSQ